MESSGCTPQVNHSSSQSRPISMGTVMSFASGSLHSVPCFEHFVMVNLVIATLTSYHAFCTLLSQMNTEWLPSSRAKYGRGWGPEFDISWPQLRRLSSREAAEAP